MFKVRRRARAVAAGADLPYCPMCQQAIRVDTVTGRCALGHRAMAPSVPLGAEVAPAVADVVDAADALVDPVTEPLTSAAPAFEDPYASIVYGRSEYDYSSESYGEPVTWDTPATAADPVTPLDDFVTWDQPVASAQEATHELPTAEARTPVEAPGADLLDELDDETYARRRAVGTIGATIGVTGAVFVAIAALPL